MRRVPQQRKQRRARAASPTRRNDGDVSAPTRRSRRAGVVAPQQDGTPLEFTPYARRSAGAPAIAAPQMGLRPISAGEWLTRSRNHAAYMAAKRRRMAAHPGVVFQALPGSQAAQAETLGLVYTHLGQTAKGKYTPAAPLDAAAHLVEEDLCVMQPRGDDYILTAASVASPSYWRLADKLGQELLDIHDPVVGLRHRIGERMRHFFRELTPERIYLRGNWFVHASGEPFRAPEHLVPNRSRRQPPRPVERLFLRCERQTVRRLPRSGAVLFTIRVFLNPLADLVPHPRLAADILAALQQPGVLDYRTRGVADRRAALLAWLREVAKW